MKAKYPNGTRCKVLVGHRIWSFENGNPVEIDIRPFLKEDTATIINTYGELSETDFRFSKSESGYSQYTLKFDNHGEISWFNESDILPLTK